MKCKRYLPLRDKTVLAFHTNHTKKKKSIFWLRKPELANPKEKRKGLQPRSRPNKTLVLGSRYCSGNRMQNGFRSAFRECNFWFQWDLTNFISILFSKVSQKSRWFLYTGEPSAFGAFWEFQPVHLAHQPQDRSVQSLNDLKADPSPIPITNVLKSSWCISLYITCTIRMCIFLCSDLQQQDNQKPSSYGVKEAAVVFLVRQDKNSIVIVIFSASNIFSPMPFSLWIMEEEQRNGFLISHKI